MIANACMSTKLDWAVLPFPPPPPLNCFEPVGKQLAGQLFALPLQSNVTTIQFEPLQLPVVRKFLAFLALPTSAEVLCLHLRTSSLFDSDLFYHRQIVRSFSSFTTPSLTLSLSPFICCAVNLFC